MEELRARLAALREQRRVLLAEQRRAAMQYHGLLRRERRAQMPPQPPRPRPPPTVVIAYGGRVSASRGHYPKRESPQAREVRLWGVEYLHPDIGNRLPQLEVLTIERLNLANPLPITMTHLFRLQRLEIHGNVAGPFAVPGVLAGIHTLESLTLSNMFADVSDALGDMPLTTLSLRRCHLPVIPACVLRMTTLQHLQLQDNGITSIAGVGRLVALVELLLAGNPLPAPPALLASDPIPPTWDLRPRAGCRHLFWSMRLAWGAPPGECCPLDELGLLPNLSVWSLEPATVAYLRMMFRGDEYFSFGTTHLMRHFRLRQSAREYAAVLERLELLPGKRCLPPELIANIVAYAVLPGVGFIQ